MICNPTNFYKHVQTFMKQYTISSENDMITLGEELAKHHTIILLEGELGAGKTTFTKGFAKGLQLKQTTIQSPTYTYLNIYEDKLLHIDMYRLQSIQELTEKGILDQINQFDYIIIERPKFIEQLSFKEYIHLTIKKTSPTSREVTVIHHQK